MTIERIANTDFSGLHDLKAQAKKDSKGALPEVAKQFEALFLQSMLKTMRMSHHFVDESSPFRGKNAETFQEMLDGQYASDMTKSENGIGIAQMLTRQLDNTAIKTQPKSTFSGQSAIMNIGAKNTIPLSADKTSTPTKIATQDIGAPSMVDDFVKSVWAKAKQAAASMGLDPKVLVAQAALETGWGKSVAKDSDGSSSNNLFNIKSGKNSHFDSVNIKTTEYIADTPIKVTANFRKYASVEESMNDYVSLIKDNGRYQNALANASNPERYVDELSKAGYATDPNYGKKILSIYHSDELNQAIQKYSLSGQI